MPDYARVPQSDCGSTRADSFVGEREDGIEGLKEGCRSCGLRKHDTWFSNRERSLVICILPLFLIIPALNLFLSASLYSQSGQPREQGNVQCVPHFEDVQMADQDCARRISSYTPALEAIEYYETDFDFVSGNESEYRGPPTEDREKLWLELWRHEGIMIETLAMPLLNRTNLEPYQKVQPEKGDGYFAWMEVHHQLECLNLVRQYTWLLMGSYAEDLIPEELRKSPEANRMHVDHCIESLRLSLMCHGDMTPLLVTKDRDELSGWRADLNTHHKCRNFTRLQEWVKVHGVEDWKTDGGHRRSHMRHV